MKHDPETKTGHSRRVHHVHHHLSFGQKALAIVVSISVIAAALAEIVRLLVVDLKLWNSSMPGPPLP